MGKSKEINQTQLNRMALHYQESQAFRQKKLGVVSLEQTTEVHSLAAQIHAMFGSGGRLRVVGLCVEPARVHSESNRRFSTQHIIDGLCAAFDASKANPFDRLVFIDIARMEDVLAVGMLPTPIPPYPKAEEIVITLAHSDHVIGVRIRENLDLLTGLVPAEDWVVMSSKFHKLSGIRQTFRHPGAWAHQARASYGSHGYGPNLNKISKDFNSANQKLLCELGCEPALVVQAMGAAGLFNNGILSAAPNK